MRLPYIALIIILCISSSCVSRNTRTSLYINPKDFPEVYTTNFINDRKNQLRTGKYLPNKLINKYLGTWESEDKSLKFKIETKRMRVSRENYKTSDFNVELDVLLLTPLYIKPKDSTSYNEQSFKEPIVLENLIHDGAYSKFAVKDPIFENTFFNISLFLNKNNSLLLSIELFNGPGFERRLVLPRGSKYLKKLNE